MRKGIMSFNPETRRFGVLEDDLWIITGLHCGEKLEWFNTENGEWIEDRIEGIYPANKPELWFFEISKRSGKDLERLRIRI